MLRKSANWICSENIKIKVGHKVITGEIVLNKNYCLRFTIPERPSSTETVLLSLNEMIY